MNPSAYKPKARHRDLLTTNVLDEIVVLDRRTNRAISLNKSMGLVWRKCDGRHTVSAIAEMLGKNAQRPVDEDLVWLTLQKLQTAKLLDGEVPRPANLSAKNRREALKVLGLGAGALAMILMPLPAAAVSCSANGIACTSDADCCSGHCCIHSSHECGTGGPGC